ncbi:MAG: ABC transporter permease [Clostridiales bacterium]|nr:ABC transporter permease [Clostridiales bacterium]
MNKIILLTKSHFKKNRGSSVGILLLMVIASLLISMSLLIITDAYPTARKESDRLNAGDGYLRVTTNSGSFDDDGIRTLMGDDVSEYCVYRCLNYVACALPFGDGDMSVNVMVGDRDAFGKTIGRTEIVTEDISVKSDYIYLPYQFSTSGGYSIGDTFSFDLNGGRYVLTVRGFTTTPYHGCNNTGSFELVVDDATYERIYERDHEVASCVTIYYKLREGVTQSKFAIRVNNDVIVMDPMAVITGNLSIENTISGRTFMSLILVVSFLTITAIVAFVIVLMLSNSISIFIRENMKTIGALKAIGYTSSDIRRSVIAQFLILSVIGSLTGIIVSFISMPFIGKFIVAQMGIPYTVSFNAIPVIVTVGSMLIFTFLIAELAVIKIRKIEPIIALRNGLESHNFKRNSLPLSKSPFSLDMSLGLKTMFFNMKQNIITFLIMGVIVFICILGLLMYENFNRNPKLGMLAFEVTGGVVAFDNDTKEEAREYLEDREDATNIRQIITLDMTYNGEDSLCVYIVDDTAKLNNQDVCYQGRLPQYDNEIAVSGVFARDYSLNIGEEVSITYGDRSYPYLITGLIQTTNNNGREGVMSMDAAGRVIDLTNSPGYFWFDCEDKETSAAILEGCNERFGDHLLSKMNFYEIIDGSLMTFKSLAALMLVTIVIISAAVILLVLYLLIKALIYNKRRDYGIYKAIGYTSRDLVLQTAISFMPSILISTVLFSVISYFTVNPFMNIIMISFGLMKCSFDIPIPGVVITAAGMIVLSFIFALISSGRVRKIEAYEMITGE